MKLVVRDRHIYVIRTELRYMSNDTVKTADELLAGFNILAQIIINHCS